MTPVKIAEIIVTHVSYLIKFRETKKDNSLKINIKISNSKNNYIKKQHTIITMRYLNLNDHKRQIFVMPTPTYLTGVKVNINNNKANKIV